MEVLFIYPDIGTRGSTRHFSCGIGSLSSVLKEKGHEPRLIYWRDEPIDIINKKIKDFSPDIIAFSSMTTQFKHIIRLSKSLFNEIDSIFICGGAHVTLAPESLKEAHLTGICRGEGEEAILELVERMREGKGIKDLKNFWWKENGVISQNPLRPLISNLDNLPFPDRDVFDYQRVIDSDFGQASFIFSRGCPFNCSYCSNHAFHRLYGEPYVRRRGVDRALEEIERVSSRYNFETIVFDDDIMTLDKNWFKNFLDGYRKNFNYPFDLNIRVEAVDKEIFSLLKGAGCRKVSIGIESGNEKLRIKVLRRRMTNYEIKDCFTQAKASGLKAKSFNLIGFPGETKESFRDTVHLNQIVNPSSLILNIFYPYPETDLYKLCHENGYIRKESKDFRERDDTILNLPDFPKKEIISLYRRFGCLVYLHNHLWKAMVYLIRYSFWGEPFLRWMEKNLYIGGRYAKRLIKILSGA